MGCGSSKGTAVGPMPVSQVWSPSSETYGKSATVNNEESSTTTYLIAAPGSSYSMAVESHYGSAESISNSTETAVSRNCSAKSIDSGLGGNRSSMTTKKLTPKLLEDADGNTKISGPVGHRNGLPPLQPYSMNKVSVHDVDPLSLEAILQKRVKFANVLINELPASSDIIKRPVSRGGVAFHIVHCKEEKQVKRIVKKPACVLKYAQHKRAAESITHDQLDEKLKAAHQRRKDQEQMRLERIWAQEERDRQVAEALARFATMQTGLRNDRSRASKEKRSSEEKDKMENPVNHLTGPLVRT